MKAWACVLILACGPAPTLMGYHRQTLDGMAEGTMECRASELQVEDTTPDDMPTMGDDPETRRYTVRGCDRETAFVCFTMRFPGAINERPECRPLRQSGDGSLGGVYVGPIRIGGD